MNSSDVGQADYWNILSTIRHADIGSRRDFTLRYAIIVCVGVALFAATNHLVYLAWVAMYLATNVAYSNALRRARAPISRSQFWTFVLGNFVSSSTYAMMPIYLWMTASSTALQFLAICGIGGHAMFNLARHNSATVISVWDTFLIVGSIALLTANQIMRLDMVAEQVLVLIGAACVAAYYVFAQSASIKDREALSVSRTETTQALKMSAMGQVTAGIAHDFNNILTVIQGNVELAQISPDPTERKELLSQAHASTVRAASVVSQMLAFVRKSPMRVETIKLSEFTNSLHMLTKKHLPRNTTFSCTISDHDLFIQTDKTLLETALLNLILNARDSIGTDEGFVHLNIAKTDEISAAIPKKPKKPGPYVCFELVDSGPGIDPQDYAKVTEPFYSTKAVGAGSGLGLSMVKGFTEQVGGAMHFRSPVNGGFEVMLVLPQSDTT